MAVDSNMPYHRVNVQANNNDTIWNGAGIGAGVGIGAMGLTYGATMHGATGLSNLNQRSAGNKATRMLTHAKKNGSPYLSTSDQAVMDYRGLKAGRFSDRMASVEGFGGNFFGSKKKMIGSAAVGLMGGMLAGGAIDYLNK